MTVRQQLATLLFDNAEMRKQLNAYTEGILTQTMERLETKRDVEKGWGIGAAITATNKSPSPLLSNAALELMTGQNNHR